jgi:uncharacterized damage-inducible protein DinB
MSIGQSLLREFDREMAGARKTLERVPDGKFDWKPHAKSMAMGHLAQHIAEISSWTVSIIDVDMLDLPADFKPEVLPSTGQVLAKFDKSVAETREQLAKVSDEHMGKPWTLKFGGKQLFAKPRIEVVRDMVLNHLIHHRAQLGVYLRLNDIPVPAIYGPSADEGGF